MVNLLCSQPPDISDQWMEYLARATGGRAFSGGHVEGVRTYDAQGRLERGEYRMQRDRSLVEDAIAFATEESRYAYQLGFYVPESEMDGKVHTLSVTLPAKPKFGLRYRRGYTASAIATAPPAAQELTEPDSKPESASPLNPDEVGIDAKIDMEAKKELRLSLALAPETVTRTADGVVVLDATFTQTDDSGKQLAKVQDTVRLSLPETPTEMVAYSRALKMINGAVLLHIRIHDRATNRVGTIAIPIGK